MSLQLPPILASPGIVSGKVVCKLLLDLTVYLAEQSETELDFLLDLYESICPAQNRATYEIVETTGWDSVAAPDLTDNGRLAAAAGRKRPYFEPSYIRIREGRAMEVSLWDARAIDDPHGSWSFACRSILSRKTGLHPFVRMLMPLSEDPSAVYRAAQSIADNVKLLSGHGGLCFVYDSWRKNPAFDLIYARARRFWGLDIEDMNDTLPLMKKAIKGVSWVTMLGRAFPDAESFEPRLASLGAREDVKVDARRHGTVILAGAEPIVGDQNRLEPLDPYIAVAEALEPAILKSHPDFPGGRFGNHANTVGWIRRFVDPAAWR